MITVFCKLLGDCPESRGCHLRLMGWVFAQLLRDRAPATLKQNHYASNNKILFPCLLEKLETTLKVIKRKLFFRSPGAEINAHPFAWANLDSLVQELIVQCLVHFLKVTYPDGECCQNY